MLNALKPRITHLLGPVYVDHINVYALFSLEIFIFIFLFFCGCGFFHCLLKEKKKRNKKESTILQADKIGLSE